MYKLDAERLPEPSEDAIATTVLGIMQEQASKWNAVANEGKESGPLFFARTQLDEYIKTAKTKKQPVTDLFRTDKRANEAHRTWIIAEREHRERSIDLSLEADAKDSQLRELLAGKYVSIEPLEDPDDVFKDPGVERAEGWVIGVSSLLGCLTIKNTTSEEITAYLIADKEGQEPRPQVSLIVNE